MGFRITDRAARSWATAPTLTLPGLSTAWVSGNAYGIDADGNEADPLRNLINPALRRRVRGALPQAFDGYARFVPGWPTSAKSLWSGVDATPEWTWIMLVRPILPDIAGHCMLISNTSNVWPTTGAAITGQAMMLFNETASNNLLRLRSQCAVHNGAATPVVSTQTASMPDFDASTAGWQIVVSRRDTSGVLYSRIAGSTTPEAISAAEPQAEALNGELIIGSQYNAAATLSFDNSLDLMANAFIDESELMDVCGMIAEWAAAHKGQAVNAPAGF